MSTRSNIAQNEMETQMSSQRPRVSVGEDICYRCCLTAESTFFIRVRSIHSYSTHQTPRLSVSSHNSQLHGIHSRCQSSSEQNADSSAGSPTALQLISRRVLSKSSDTILRLTANKLANISLVSLWFLEYEREDLLGTEVSLRGETCQTELT